MLGNKLVSTTRTSTDNVQVDVAFEGLEDDAALKRFLCDAAASTVLAFMSTCILILVDPVAPNSDYTTGIFTVLVLALNSECGRLEYGRVCSNPAVLLFISVRYADCLTDAG